MTAPAKKGVRAPRKIETQKKKARRAIPRKKATRILGSTMGARTRLKKLAGKARNAKIKAAAKA
jgi:hypothetical protein